FLKHTEDTKGPGIFWRWQSRSQTLSSILGENLEVWSASNLGQPSSPRPNHFHEYRNEVSFPFHKFPLRGLFICISRMSFVSDSQCPSCCNHDCVRLCLVSGSRAGASHRQELLLL